MLDGKKQEDTLDVIFMDTVVSCARKLMLWFNDTFWLPLIGCNL
jgi:hypothetical protein